MVNFGLLRCYLCNIKMVQLFNCSQFLPRNQLFLILNHDTGLCKSDETNQECSKVFSLFQLQISKQEVNSSQRLFQCGNNLIEECNVQGGRLKGMRELMNIRINLIIGPSATPERCEKKVEIKITQVTTSHCGVDTHKFGHFINICVFIGPESDHWQHLSLTD